jgi:hypothetical protein
VKKSVRDESTWDVAHLYMEAMLGISLYSYPLSQVAQMLSLSYYCLYFLFNKIRGKSRTDSAWKRNGVVVRGTGCGVRGKHGPNNVCTYE